MNVDLELGLSETRLNGEEKMYLQRWKRTGAALVKDVMPVK